MSAIDMLREVSERYHEGLRLGFYTENRDEPVIEVLDRDGAPVSECPDCLGYVAADTVRLVERCRV